MRPARPNKHDRPYTQYVKGLAEGGYPNLEQLYHFLHKGDESRFKSTAWYLDLDLDGQSREPKKIGKRELKDRAHKPLNNVLARIFVIVDLDTEMIESLGDALNLEAAFFSDHISDSFGENRLANGRCPHLPSVSEITSFYTIDYFTAITLNNALDNARDELWCCESNVRRRSRWLSCRLTVQRSLPESRSLCAPQVLFSCPEMPWLRGLERYVYAFVCMTFLIQ